ncbi:M20 metallopeptidase family protein [[Mycoplasma] testudinis]|uniref:M20 metallopeptidase family protein n=1 Tax=[Mycoplasma] testudinis TaxID=33924 RepID=UPI0005606506|nr:amidohydrolase [[Mycoplasma] testudinis]
MANNIQKIIKKYEKDLVSLRHDLHQNPEIGMKESKTADKLKKLLTSWGYSISKETFANTGFVATLKNGNSKKAIGLRCEMDALPIEEVNSLPYASKNKGIMHACGHDGHMTMVMGAARYLAETKNWNGTLRIFCQPNEEASGNISGGLKMIQDGVFKKYPVDQIFAIHNMPAFAIPNGKPGGLYFYMKEDGIMAGIDVYNIKLTGNGGHGSAPEFAKDVITCAADMVMALQSIVSRNIPASDRAVLNVGSIHSGNAANVIPETAEIAVSTRSVTHKTRAKLKERIYQIVNSIAAAYEIKADIWTDGTGPTINDPKANAYARKIAEKALGKDLVNDAIQMMASEDFSAMLDVIPGSYAFICNDTATMVHNDKFNFDDKVIVNGSTYFSALVEDYLK